MALDEEIKQMRIRGLTDVQVKDNLKARGVSDVQISGAISQSETGNYANQSESLSSGQDNPEEIMEPTVQNQNRGEMEKSLLLPEADNQDSQFSNQQRGIAEYTPQYPVKAQEYESTPPTVVSQSPNATVQEYAEQSYQEYQPYQSYSSGPSPDLITEITEQIISEKLSVVRKALEKSIDIRNTLGTKVDYIEERLKRIEKIIDTLQSSVLRKVGDYVNDIQDVKKELIETQKSFSKIVSEKRDHKIHVHKKHGKK